MGLEEALSAGITNAQAGSAWEEEGDVDVDQDARDAVLDLWDRIDVALDLVREHNGLYAAVLAQDLGGRLAQLSTLAGVIVDAAIDRSIEDVAKRAQESLAAFDAAWKTAALSVAKVPADVAVDVAVGAAITTAVPLVLGAAGVTGTLPAVLVAGAIAMGASVAWNAATDSWGPDIGSLQQSVQDTNGIVDIAADTAGIDQVGQGFKAGADHAGKVSLALTVLLDLAATGVAIEGIYEAASAWEAFEIERVRLEELWADMETIGGGFARSAEQMNTATALLSEEIGRRNQAITALDSVYGEGLYDV